MSDRLAEKHLPQLDGLRGVAILLVMVYHFLDLLTPYRPSGSVARWAWAAAGAGWIGVDLFFVLSGFLITGILLDSRGSNRYFSSFYMRRILRISPLYYAILIVVLIVAPLVRRPEAPAYHVLQEHQAWYWTYLTNWFIAWHGDFRGVPGGFFWSLAVEEQFYLVWPLIVLWLDRQTLLRLCSAVIVASPLIRLCLLASGWSPTTLYVMTFTHLEPLAVGAALAAVMRGGSFRAASFQAKTFRAATVRERFAEPTLYVLAAASGALLALLFLWCAQLKFWDARVAGVGTTLLALVFGCWLHRLRVASPASWSRRWCEAAPLQSCGRLSYALYLFHLPVAVTVRKFVFDPLPRLQMGNGSLAAVACYLALAGAGSWLIAWLSWHLFEKHFLRLKRFFPAKTPDALPVPLAA